MRSSLLYLLAAGLALSFAHCTKHSPSGLGSSIVKDDLNDPSLWSYEVLDSTGYISASSAGIFSNGAIEISLIQGEDCQRSKASQDLEEYSNSIEEAIEQGDTLILALDGVSSDYSGMGAASFVFHFANRKLSVNIPYGASSTEYLVYISDDEVQRLLVNGTETDDVPLYISFTESSTKDWSFLLNVSACGADLYAYAQISMERIRLYQKP
ncbi:MAG: hypothetical protein HQ500_10015 [Flavobacteriales bacterium]|nr:hypothetical protein [Flavobacteriales bacterium]